MDNLGYSSDAAQDIYRLLIETPTSYAAYGYGKLFFYNRVAEKLNGYIGLGVLALYILNIIFGLLPIYFLLKKTPAEILSKYDI